MNKELFEIILVSGNDRHTFLQGQLTQDIEKLTSEELLFAAICNPKGRVYATCQLFKTNNKIGIITPSSMTKLVIQRLQNFIFRSDVELERIKNTCSICINCDNKSNGLQEELINTFEKDKNKSPSHFLIKQSLKKSRNIEIYSNQLTSESIRSLENLILNSSKWKKARMIENIVDITIENSEKYTPHMINLDLINGISFKKGCYVGQEIVARTEHIGSVKRRAVLYNLSSSKINNNEKLFIDKSDSGAHILYIVEDKMIAIINTAISNKELTFENGQATPINQSN